MCARHVCLVNVPIAPVGMSLQRLAETRERRGRWDVDREEAGVELELAQLGLERGEASSSMAQRLWLTTSTL